MKLRKENNVTYKLNSTGKLNGIYPAIKKVAEWIGSEDKWDVYYVAAKQYHTLLCDKMNSNIRYDVMMNKLKSEYEDSFGRVAKIFKNESDAINYLQA